MKQKQNQSKPSSAKKSAIKRVLRRSTYQKTMASKKRAEERKKQRKSNGTFKSRSVSVFRTVLVHLDNPEGEHQQKLKSTIKGTHPDIYSSPSKSIPDRQISPYLFKTKTPRRREHTRVAKLKCFVAKDVNSNFSEEFTVRVFQEKLGEAIPEFYTKQSSTANKTVNLKRLPAVASTKSLGPFEINKKTLKRQKLKQNNSAQFGYYSADALARDFYSKSNKENIKPGHHEFSHLVPSVFGGQCSSSNLNVATAAHNSMRWVILESQMIDLILKHGSIFYSVHAQQKLDANGNSTHIGGNVEISSCQLGKIRVEFILDSTNPEPPTKTLAAIMKTTVDWIFTKMLEGKHNNTKLSKKDDNLSSSNPPIRRLQF